MSIAAFSRSSRAACAALAIAVLPAWLICDNDASATDTSGSKVSSAYGQVSFIGDDAPHKLSIRLSRTDIGDKTIPARAPSAQFNASARQAASGWAGFAAAAIHPDPNDATAGLRQDLLILDPLSSLVISAITLPQLQALVSSFVTAGENLIVADEALLAARLKREAASKALQETIDRGGNVGGARDTLAARTRAWELATRAFKSLGIQFNTLKSRVFAELAQRPPNMPQGTFGTWKSKAMQIAAKVDSKVSFLSIAVVLAASAYASAAPTDMQSHERIIIEDKANHPIVELDDGCRHEVRERDGAVLPNTVSCSVPQPPTIWSIWTQLFGGDPFVLWSGVRVTTGSAHDEIVANLPATMGIDTFALDAGGGPDDVYVNTSSNSQPSDYRWQAWVSGGEGNDLIALGPEYDQVWGDIPGSTGEAPVTGGFNDRIGSGAGKDYVHAQWGHNLVLAGRDDDVVSAYDGNNVLVGGRGKDIFRNGAGNVLIAAQELSGAQEIDPGIECGTGAKRYVTLTPGQDAQGNKELAPSCSAPPPIAPTTDSVVRAFRDPVPAGGNWQWLG